MGEGDRSTARGGTVAYTSGLFGAIGFDEVCPDEGEDVAVGWSTRGVSKHALGMILVELFKLGHGPVHPVQLSV